MNVNFNFGEPYFYKDYKHLSIDELREWANDRIRKLKDNC